jgi:hypothetical protein
MESFRGQRRRRYLPSIPVQRRRTPVALIDKAGEEDELAHGSLAEVVGTRSDKAPRPVLRGVKLGCFAER